MQNRPPLSEPARQIIAAMGGGMTRRNLLRLGGGAAAAAALAACAPPAPPAALNTGSAAPTLALPTDVSATEKILNWANWTAYLDQDDDGNYTTLDAFMKKTGIKVSYTEDIDDNDSYFNKIAPQLRAKQDIKRDIFTFTDWMANRVIREQLAQPLEMFDMPNVAAHLLPTLRNVSFDPGRKYSVPWQGGYAGIGYHKKKVGRELKSLDDLWADDLKGKVTVLSEFRDTAALIMQQRGVDIAGNWGKPELEAAFAEVSKRVADGNIRRIRGNAYLEDLKAGNAIAGIVWSGDLFILRAETEDDNWEFVIPESGGTLWTDNMMVPITSTHRANAMKLFDYYYDPKVAAEVAAWVNYITPVVGAQEEMLKIDKDLAASPLIFPTEEYIKEKKIQSFRALSATEEAEYGAMWAKVVGN